MKQWEHLGASYRWLPKDRFAEEFEVELPFFWEEHDLANIMGWYFRFVKAKIGSLSKHPLNSDEAYDDIPQLAMLEKISKDYEYTGEEDNARVLEFVQKLEEVQNAAFTWKYIQAVPEKYRIAFSRSTKCSA